MKTQNLLVVSARDGLTSQDIINADLFIVVRVNECDFTIVKNRWGTADDSLNIPLRLLPDVIQHPEGKLDWV